MKSFSLKKTFALFLFPALLLGLMGTFVLSSSAAESDTVQNVSAQAYNGGAVVTWDKVPEASSYEISYGLYSVAEGLASAYDEMADAGDTDSYALGGLTNGVKYYLAIKAVFADGKKSSEFSTEVDVTPSSVYEALPGQEVERAAADESAEAPVVNSAEALTKNMVKVMFSKDIVLPQILPELSFSVVRSDDSSVSVPVEKVEYKVDYAGKPNEQIHKDTLFLTMDEDLELDVEYTVTVSAAVTDENKTPLVSGATDFAEFTGTDRTEIPEDERPLTSTGNTPDTTVSEPETPGNAETPPAPPVDIAPPENVTDFTATSKERETDFWIDLTWTKSASPDVVDQKFYQGTNGTFDSGTSLGRDADKYGTSGVPETEMTYKVTALDAAGNESSGTITSLRLPKLASTGAPFALLALGASLALSGIRKFRKK